eukprot:NODE_2663_length_1148_cov_13.147407_g2441_i0.p1 GENE.NODE_2663_length_1148_cov_13.147407_g2441_i0~~NODE_2663_length_1148_cov_13.147407_g2441_i0.p1  ORF type:complete len:323 (-),score=59.81 NODE_2663_length_1148_cov_13.147407_g2441_i0:179-1147(-)
MGHSECLFFFVPLSFFFSGIKTLSNAKAKEPRMPVAKDTKKKAKSSGGFAAAASAADVADSVVVVKKQKTSESTSVATKLESNARAQTVKKFLRFDAEAFLIKILQTEVPAITGGRWAFGLQVFRLSAPEDQVEASVGEYCYHGQPFKVIENNRPDEKDYPLLAVGDLRALFMEAVKMHVPGRYGISISKLFRYGCAVFTTEANLPKLKSATALGITFEFGDCLVRDPEYYAWKEKMDIERSALRLLRKRQNTERNKLKAKSEPIVAAESNREPAAKASKSNPAGTAKPLQNSEASANKKAKKVDVASKANKKTKKGDAKAK